MTVSLYVGRDVTIPELVEQVLKDIVAGINQAQAAGIRCKIPTEVHFEMTAHSGPAETPIRFTVPVTD